MPAKIIVTVFAAAIGAGIIATSPASAIGGLGGPECGFGSTWNGERCVPVAPPRAPKPRR
jgi:hypothetical protein